MNCKAHKILGHLQIIRIYCVLQSPMHTSEHTS